MATFIKLNSQEKQSAEKMIHYVVLQLPYSEKYLTVHQFHLHTGIQNAVCPWPGLYCERRLVNFSSAVQCYPLWAERNLSVATGTVLSCKACENTLCPVGTES